MHSFVSGLITANPSFVLSVISASEANNVNFLFTSDTFEVLNEVRGLIPNHPIDEHDIYGLLKEMYFEQAQKIIYEKVCTFEGDEKKGIPPEYEQVEIGRIFVWNLYEK